MSRGIKIRWYFCANYVTPFLTLRRSCYRLRDPSILSFAEINADKKRSQSRALGRKRYFALLPLTFFLLGKIGWPNDKRLEKNVPVWVADTRLYKTSPSLRSWPVSCGRRLTTGNVVYMFVRFYTPRNCVYTEPEINFPKCWDSSRWLSIAFYSTQRSAKRFTKNSKSWLKFLLLIRLIRFRFVKIFANIHVRISIYLYANQ